MPATSHTPALPAALKAAACAALCVLFAATPGCARRPGNPALSRTTTRPAVRGADRGLEIWSWAVSDPRRQLPVDSSDPARPGPALLIRDDKTDIESLLWPYLARPVPIPDAVRDRWRASGLRAIAVPAADLDRLLNASRLVGTVQRQWLGEVPAWTDAALGPALHEPRTIAVGDGDSTLEPGRLRLLVRAWTVPVERDSGIPAAGLHVELAPRLDPFVPERERMMAAAAGEPQTPPHTFPTLAATLTLAQGEALVIVPDAPDVDWARPAPETQPDEYGPQPPPVPTLGEVLLASPGSWGTVRTRAIVALIPHLSDRFELIAR